MHTHLTLVYEGCDSCGVLKSTDFCFYLEGTFELEFRYVVKIGGCVGAEKTELLII